MESPPQHHAAVVTVDTLPDTSTLQPPPYTQKLPPHASASRTHTHTTRDAICSGALAQGYKDGYRYPTRTGKRPGGRRARSEATRTAVSSVCVSNVSPIPPVSPLCLPLPFPAPCVSRRGRTARERHRWTVREECGNSTGGQRARCSPAVHNAHNSTAQYHRTIARAAAAPANNTPGTPPPLFIRAQTTPPLADTPARAPHKPPHEHAPRTVPHTAQHPHTTARGRKNPRAPRHRPLVPEKATAGPARKATALCRSAVFSEGRPTSIPRNNSARRADRSVPCTAGSSRPSVPALFPASSWRSRPAYIYGECVPLPAPVPSISAIVCAVCYPLIR